MIKRVIPSKRMNYFTEGKSYVVKNEDDNEYLLVDDDGDENWYDKDDFEISNIYKSYEVAEMLAKHLLCDDDIVTMVSPSGLRKEFKVFGHSLRDPEDDREVGNSFLGNGHNYEVNVKEKPVTFQEAIMSGKKIKFVCDGEECCYKDLDSLFEHVGCSYDSDEIREIIQKGEWFIER